MDGTNMTSMEAKAALAQPEAPPEIPSRLDELSDAMTALEQNIDALSGELSPILAETEPGEGGEVNPSRSDSEIGRRIESVIERARRATSQVGSLRRRVRV